MKPVWWEDAKIYLCKSDPILSKIIECYPESILYRSSDAFSALVNSIIGQQISVKAAHAIRGRLQSQIGFTSSILRNAPIETLRSVGLSSQKAGYIKNIAQWFELNAVDEQWFEKTDNSIIRSELLKIKGIGNWTVEMFEMFYLLDANILPKGDLGLIKGIESAYAVNRLEAKELLLELEKKWSPYLSAATWYLWRSLDPKEVNY